MKAPSKIELNTCTFSDIGIFDVDEEEVVYIREDEVLKLLSEKEEISDYPTMFEGGWYTGRETLRSELKEKISNL